MKLIRPIQIVLDSPKVLYEAKEINEYQKKQQYFIYRFK